MTAKITKPIRRAIDEGHGDRLYWEYSAEGLSFRLEAVTGHHENGRLITRKLWESCDAEHARRIAELLLEECGIDTKDELLHAIFAREERRREDRLRW